MNTHGKTCTLKPVGWETTLEGCPPGFFAWEYRPKGLEKTVSIEVGFKSEYTHLSDGSPMTFNEAGEYCNLTKDTKVQPLEITWEFLL